MHHQLSVISRQFLLVFTPVNPRIHGPQIFTLHQQISDKNILIRSDITKSYVQNSPKTAQIERTESRAPPATLQSLRRFQRKFARTKIRPAGCASRMANLSVSCTEREAEICQ
ncbi:hypothetical protein SS50377_21395 [Spironucleus salmonicida]|uniref:Uncharacterized protein n=1 Tax=Spironucleus salmonicida TaxID=348837 RepID=A0A9P8LWZ1_9EUKA|nr:hypothetical protein SS50377_21395 [Spironucleus salmonicida]